MVNQEVDGHMSTGVVAGARKRHRTLLPDETHNSRVGLEERERERKREDDRQEIEGRRVRNGWNELRHRREPVT